MLGVALVDGEVVEDCANVRREVAGVAITFDEPVQNADEIDRYRMVAAGPDADVSTDVCGEASGDDLHLVISGVTSDLDPATPTYTLELEEVAPSGWLRVIVCETVEDLGGLALDGDGDGTGGDPMLRTFRVDSGNLLVNGDFDRCPVTLAPWIDMATPPDAILPSEPEDVDASTLSGSARILSATADSAGLAQCVDLPQGVAKREMAFALEGRLDAFGAATATLTALCELFDTPSCAGSPTTASAMRAPLPDLAGAWTRFVVRFEPPPTSASALCSVAVTPTLPGEPGFDAYLDRLSLREVSVFADGFESGDTSAWSSSVGD